MKKWVELTGSEKASLKRAVLAVTEWAEADPYGLLYLVSKLQGMDEVMAVATSGTFLTDKNGDKLSFIPAPISMACRRYGYEGDPYLYFNISGKDVFLDINEIKENLKGVPVA